MAVTVTLATLKVHLGHMLGDPDETTYTAAKKLAALNLARDYVTQFFLQWPGKSIVSSTTLTMVSGTETYAIDKEVFHVEKVIVVDDDGNYIPIRPIPFGDTESFESSSSTDYPLYWYRVGNTLGFKPKPTRADTVTVYYTKQANDLASDSDAITMPPWIRNLILFKAADYISGWGGDHQSKRAFASDFEEAKREAEVLLSNYQNQEPPRSGMRQIWEWHLPYAVAALE